jgi:hypothetical protein
MPQVIRFAGDGFGGALGYGEENEDERVVAKSHSFGVHLSCFDVGTGLGH